ncbi:MAG: Rpn family recombination-promoting nuclease/putative transposase [Mediterranea sp.]|jgi:predicted transposase/invertase (TIGR01784 family)|nr:Rpn family recombination-promoting nuclease/putative transposase [Mediterranea sp.]
MRYLDPKADMIFKLVFGEHPDLVKSLLNALLPLEAGQEIEEIEYLSPEMIPETPLNKFSIVDVRCRDNLGRQFIVEMQMVWSAEFRQRVLFNASKAYVRQLGPSEDYRLLQPVYSLNLVNDLFEPDLQGYYHYYRLVHTEHNDKVIDGLHLVFVELPKYTPTTYKEKKMKVLWLRFLTEIDEKTRQVPEELLANPDIQKAVAVVEESAFTEAQLLGYEKFWDGVRIEKTLINSALRAEERGMEKGIKKGIQEGMEKGLEEGMQKGMQKGREESMEDVALSMIADKLPYATISKYTGLSIEKIQELAEKDLRH